MSQKQSNTGSLPVYVFITEDSLTVPLCFYHSLGACSWTSYH